MKKILLSLLSIGAVAVIAVAATGAFFSDTEESIGNTLVAGAIDLKVDNTCYYNGQACIGGFWNGEQVHGNECACTWGPTDLSEEHLFFDIADIKPGDYEEDTISLAVEFNEAWLCADVHLTSDKDNDCTDPENDDEGLAVCGSGDPNTNGDLADEIRFLWWADDGDNVLEDNENQLQGGPLGFLTVSSPVTVTLADSITNIWTGSSDDPIPQGGDPLFIGKAWCFGDISAAPDDQDEFGNIKTPAGDNAGESTGQTPDGVAGTPADGGYLCDGSGVNNAAQTDSLMVDIAFRAEQARNNSPFFCRTP